jgi:thiamine-monophosphate kinase
MTKIGDQKLKDMGEYGLHALLKDILIPSPLDKIGVGDDCSLIRVDDNKYLAISMDRAAPSALLRSFRYAGQLCAIQNISDILAVGAKPFGLLLGTFFPPDTPVLGYADVIAGAQEICRKYDTFILGGDTKESEIPVIVGCSLGFVSDEAIIRRTGAKSGDILCLTLKRRTKIGVPWSYFLVSQYDVPIDADRRKWFEENYYIDNLTLPYDETFAVIQSRGITCGTDTSDGIGGAALILSKAANLGIEFDRDALLDIIHPYAIELCDHLRIEPERMAFSPGFVWENLFGIEPGLLDAAIAAARSVGGDLVPIGRFTDALEAGMRIGADVRKINLLHNENFQEAQWLARLAEHWRKTSLY